MAKIIDLHCDTIMALYQNRELSLEKNDLQIDLEKLYKGNYLAQVFAMFVYLKAANPYQVCNEMLDLFYLEQAKNKDKLNVALKYDDINNSLVNAILSIEEGGVIEGDINKLIHFYNRGIRMVCLNWNFVNGIGHPNFILNEKPDFTVANNVDGLTPFGFEVVRKMDELGMIIDVSHLSDKGFWDVYTTTKNPFIASHSNARSVCNHVRNLTDEMIKALASRGGVIGLNFCTNFINENSKTTLVSDIVKHALHIIDIGGIDCLAVGTDFDGIGRTTEIDNASEMNKLYLAFKEVGLSEEDIEKIFCKNFLRVFKEVCR